MFSKSGQEHREFDLTICDREPIHIPGAIQPHGVLLVLDPDIVQVAGDTEALLGAPHDFLLGQSFEARLWTVAAMKTLQPHRRSGRCAASASGFRNV